MIHDAIGGNPPTVNFVMFVAVFAMLSLIYLIAASINEGFAMVAWGPLIVDGINVFLFLIAGIVMAAQLGVHSCGNGVMYFSCIIYCVSTDKLQDYVDNNIITSGSFDNTKRCHEGQAVTAFLWFGFATFLASLFFSFLGARSGGANLRGGIRRGGPIMSQV